MSTLNFKSFSKFVALLPCYVNNITKCVRTIQPLFISKICDVLALSELVAMWPYTPKLALYIVCQSALRCLLVPILPIIGVNICVYSYMALISQFSAFVFSAFQVFGSRRMSLDKNTKIRMRLLQFRIILK